MTRPIAAIPLHAIEKIQTFAIPNEEYKKGKEKN